MNDAQIKCFLAAARYENFTKAAESLFLSQPVVGRHISNLEEELGFSLFTRERKSVKLTENGRLFAEFLQECTDQYSALMDRIQNNLRTESMHLILGTVEGQNIGDTYAAAFRYQVDNMPHFILSIKYYLNAEIIDAVVNGTVDAIIVDEESIGRFKDMLDYQVINSLHTNLIVPITHPAAEKRTISIEDFQDDRFILLSRKDSEITMEIQKSHLEIMGIHNFIEAPDISTLSAWVSAGIGITTVPENHRICSSPDVLCLDLPEIRYVYNDVIAWSKNNRNPAIETFCNVLKASGYGQENKTYG